MSMSVLLVSSISILLMFQNPANPSLVAGLDLKAALGYAGNPRPREVIVKGNYVYVTAADGDNTWDGLLILDISNPLVVSLAGSIVGGEAPNFLLHAYGLAMTSLPTVQTDPATELGIEAATLNGTLNDDLGEACACGFQWGKTVAYGNTTPTQSKTAGQSFLQAITGLKPNTTYHFRAQARNSAGVASGADMTFKTLTKPEAEAIEALYSLLDPSLLLLMEEEPVFK